MIDHKTLRDIVSLDLPKEIKDAMIHDVLNPKPEPPMNTGTAIGLLFWAIIIAALIIKFA